MKIFLACFVLSVISAVSAQLDIVEASEVPTDVPSEMPSVRGPPTDFPTPEGEFEYLPWGETSFGDKYQDLYWWGHQHAIRRPGWSWDEPLAGYAPFCYGNKTVDKACGSVVSACDALGGVLLHDSYCSFPESVKIAGPSCWQGNCVAEGGEVCRSLGGITVKSGDQTAEWCLLTGDYTVFGPACYNKECYQEEMAAVCSSLNGAVWNRNYCILPKRYTVIGPVCWRAACFAGTQNECNSIGGTPVAKWWCLKEGCDYTVIGPTCSMVPEDIQEQCFEDDTIAACNAVGGDLFAQRFCIIPGTDWTMIGPNAYYDSEQINFASRFCRELQDNIGPPFAGLRAYDIGKRFCLVNRRLPPVGPFCQGNTCYEENNTALCDASGGETNGPFMCALPPTYRRAEGPLMWNGQMLETSHPNCTGFFCAIPEPSGDETLNLRCPGSPIGPGSSGPRGPNDGPSPPGPGAAVSRSHVVALIGLVALVVKLW